jgi:uncharacterized protein (TIGR02145 family)
MNPLLPALLLITLAVSGQTPEKPVSGSFTDPRDGHTYKTVTLGNQVWMAENLAFLPSVNLVSDAGFEDACYYVYGYHGKNVEEAVTRDAYHTYGALYNWKAATISCPDGWHLPTDVEWRELEKILGMEYEPLSRSWIGSGAVGKKIRSADGWKMGNATGESGFNALPAGCRGYSGFESMGFCGYFWTATPSGTDNGWRRGFCGDNDGSCREEDRKYFGISVRCVKN